MYGGRDEYKPETGGRFRPGKQTADSGTS